MQRPIRPGVVPPAQTRPAPTGLADGPATRGPGRGVLPLVALLGLLVALLGLLAFAGTLATRRGRAPGDSAAPASPATPPSGDLPARPPHPSRPEVHRLGELLHAADTLSRQDLRAALQEQARSGGRLGEILTAAGILPVAAVTEALARQLGMAPLGRDDRPIARLEVQDARAWRAVALTGSKPAHGGVAVATANPTRRVLADLEATLGCPVEPRLRTRRRWMSCCDAYTQTRTPTR